MEVNGYRIVTIAVFLSYFLFSYQMGEFRNYAMSALRDNVERERGVMLWNQTSVVKKRMQKKWKQETGSSLYYANSSACVGC